VVPAQGLTSGVVIFVSVETFVRAQDLMQGLCRCANSKVRQETGSICAVLRSRPSTLIFDVQNLHAPLLVPLTSPKCAWGSQEPQ
jgi:hypothetical protein